MLRAYNLAIIVVDSIIIQVRDVLQKFHDGYTARDKSKLNEFMEVFAPSDEIELIGVGASDRGGNEWFQGHAVIREISEGGCFNHE